MNTTKPRKSTTGLCSVTFRKRGIAEVAKICACAGLDGIEWGGDIHVPPGNIQAAKQAADATAAHNLKVLSYGSYYRGEPRDEIKPVLQSAAALGTKTVRVWAGSCDYQEVEPDYIKIISSNIKAAAKTAADQGITLCFEFHGKTLCNSADNTIKMLARIDEPNVKTYWQTLGSVEHNLAAIENLNNRVAAAHIFHWVNGRRLALKKGADVWIKYLAALKKHAPDAPLIMEFVRRDSPNALIKDAKSLLFWLGNG